MTYLLDVNVLIALIDPAHLAHDAAHRWFGKAGAHDWASCPLTENGVIRIVGHPKYPNTPGSPAIVAEIMTTLRNLPGHTFWPDDLSLVGSDDVDATRLVNPAHVTDTYLLALAKSRHGQLATFDRKLPTAAVRQGADAHFLIPST